MGLLIAVLSPLLLVVFRSYLFGGFFVSVPPHVRCNERNVQVREILLQGLSGGANVACIRNLLAAQAAYQNFELKKSPMSEFSTLGASKWGESANRMYLYRVKCPEASVDGSRQGGDYNELNSIQKGCNRSWQLLDLRLSEFAQPTH